MSANRVIEFIIRAKTELSDAASGANKFGADLKRKFSELSSWVKSTWAGRLVSGVKGALGAVGGAVSGIFHNLMNIKAGFDMIASAARSMSRVVSAVWGTVVDAMKDETAVRQLEMLSGSLEKAKKLYAEIEEMGMTPPFSADQFMAVTRSLWKFSDGVLNTKDMLELVGDTAYKTNNSIESVGDIFGRAYALIRDGEPLSRATMTMRNMGMVSPAVVAQLEDMYAAGAKSSEIWEVLTDAMRKNSGAMQSTLTTGDGLVAAVKSTWQEAVEDFGAAFLDLAKTELTYVLNKIREFRSDGSIQRWAESAKTAITPLVEAFGNLFDGESRTLTIDAAWDSLKAVFEYGLDMMRAGADYLYFKIKAAMAFQDDVAENYSNAASRGFSGDAMLADAKLKRTLKENAAIVEQAADDRRKRAEINNAVDSDLKDFFGDGEEAETPEQAKARVAEDLDRGTAEANAKAAAASELKAAEKAEKDSIDAQIEAAKDALAQNDIGFGTAARDKMLKESEDLNKKASKGFSTDEYKGRLEKNKLDNERAKDEASMERRIKFARDMAERPGSGFSSLPKNMQELIKMDDERKQAKIDADTKAQQAIDATNEWNRVQEAEKAKIKALEEKRNGLLEEIRNSVKTAIAASE